MLMLRPPRSGFSLIELMITMAVLFLLLLAAIPSFATWVADSRVRSAAESLQNGLRLAAATAVQRNRQSVFALTGETPSADAQPAANGRNWAVSVLPLPGSTAAADSADANSRFVRGDTFGTQAAVKVNGPALLCFSPLGEQISLDAASTGLDTTCAAGNPVVYAVSAPGADRPLQVQVHLGGRVRLCDPAKTLSAENPDGC
jgi:type IV fimbrial biogenesis protein FimT